MSNDKKIAYVLKWESSDRKLYDCGRVIEEISFKYKDTNSPARFFHSKDRDEGNREHQLDARAKELAIYYVERRNKGEVFGDGEYCGLENFVSSWYIPKLIEWAEKEILRREKQKGTKAKKERNEEKRQDSMRRAKARIRRIANTNDFCVMWTFTFANERQAWQDESDILETEKQRDCREISRVWNKFLTRFRYYFGKQAFIKVLERHDGAETTSDKRETFHIHLACSFLCNKYLLQAIWGHGNIWYDDFRKKKVKRDGKTVSVKRKEGVKNPGVYISKYIEKDFGKLDYGMRNYTCSKSNQRYRTVKNEDDCRQIMQDSILYGYRQTFESSMDVKVNDKSLTVKVRRLEDGNRKVCNPRNLVPLPGTLETVMRQKSKKVKEFCQSRRVQG